MMKKIMLAAVVMSLMMVCTTGCGSEQAQGEEPVSLMTSEQSDEVKAEEPSNQVQDNVAEEEGETTEEETEGNEPEGAVHENSEEGNDASGSNGTDSRELIFTGGKVKSVSQDSFVISRTLMEGSIVVMPGEGGREEELLTVRCMDSTEFERWIIQGGGADIKKEEADFSEIQEGTGLEAQGYFDGEEFVAEKVMIEIYE